MKCVGLLKLTAAEPKATDSDEVPFCRIEHITSAFKFKDTEFWHCKPPEEQCHKGFFFLKPFCVLLYGKFCSLFICLNVFNLLPRGWSVDFIIWGFITKCSF